MNDFWIWFSTGLQHILDWNGYDHILYIIALMVMFPTSEWRKLLLLVTSFTIGHSLTLALSTSNCIIINQSYIELLIPLTIVATCLSNMYFAKKEQKQTNYTLNYFIALVFGLIHGMGFSYLLKSMLGRETNIIYPLLSFNLGLEVGQLIIVFAMLILSVFLSRFTKIKPSNFVFSISLVVLLIASLLVIQRINTL